MAAPRTLSMLTSSLVSSRQALRIARPRCPARLPTAPSRRMATQTPTPTPTPGPSPNPRGGAAPPTQLRDKSIVGPFTWKAGALFIVTGTALYYYFEQEKAKIKQKKREESATTSIGRPNIGGPFRLATHHNPSRTFTEADLLGRWNLLYFGFTNCPDICPEELDKMGVVVDETDKMTGKQLVQPIFISCDPARDTVEQVRAYMSDFHPRMIGLTGPYEQVKQACKSYRVYFSTPPDAKPTEDYLVDHSIFFYLMDPDGKFVDAFGKNSTAEDVTKKLMEAVGRYESR